MSDFVEILVRGAANNETRVTARRAEMIVIGRERGCDLIIEDDAIAARQARLSWEGDLMRLEPLAQTVALRLDDLPITESVLIRSQQTIAAGASSITWRFLSQEECPTIASVSAESEIADSTAETLARKLSSGRYETAGRQLGLGGMGKVDEVVDRSLGRSVAMKLMLKPESLRDQERFIREAQITGQLEHPSIVPVHELNVDRCGRIFYTMKLLRGLTLAQLLKNLEAGKDETLGRCDLSALLIIFQKLCDAVAFAHSQEPAVIHRDLKPENIMVGEYGEVQVMDWGLAKILGAPSLPAFEEKRRPEMAVFPGYDGTTPDLALTLEGEIMGTPAYMPPEQARGDIKGQDQRTDIYALGAILYAILFLKPPLELIEIQTPQNRPQRRFGEEERGPLPRATNQVLADRIQSGEVACAVRKGERLPKLRYSPWISVPESLAAIVRKAMALAPAHRYARVLDLQADVAAYQRGFATKAEDAGAWRQFLLLVRRHRAVSAATAAAVLLIAILSVAFTVAVSRERDRVRASNVELQQTLTKASFADLEAARQSFVKGEWRMGAALLGRALVFDPANQAASDYLLSALAVAGGDADMLPRFGVLHSGPGTAVDFSPDGSRFATASYDRTARVWEAATGKPVGLAMEHSRPLCSVKFSPDGRRLLTTGEDGFARLWNAESGEAIGKPMLHGDIVETGTFSPDGRLILTGSWDGFARLWDANSCQELRRFSHTKQVAMAAFNRDASRIVTASWDQTAQVWDAISGEKIGAAMTHAGTVRRAFFSPDGSRVVTTSKDGTARIWDAATGSPVSPPLQHGGFVWTAAISPDGKLVATASHDNQARLWRMEDGAVVGRAMHHNAPLESIAFSPDGGRILTASRDNTVRLWDGKTGEPIGRAMRHDNSVLVAIFNPSGSQVVSVGWDQAAYLWDTGPAPAPGLLVPIPAAVQQAEFSSDHDVILVTLGDHTVRFWSLTARQYVGPVFDHGAPLVKVRTSPNRSIVATVGEDSVAKFWSCESGKLLGQIPAQSRRIFDAAFSADGSSLFTGGEGGNLCEWSVPAGLPQARPRVFPGDVYAMAVSPDGKELAAGGRDYFISRYDLRRDVPPDRRIRLDEYAVALGYSPDGKKLATGSERRSARVWTLAAEPASTAHFIVEGKVSSLRWTADSQRLVVSGSEDPRVYCRNVESSSLALEPLRHPGGVSHLAVSDDGSKILTVGIDGKARLWPASARIPPGEWLRDYLRAASGLGFSKEQQLVSVSMRERLMLREKLLAADPPDSIWRDVLERSLAPTQ